MATYDELYSLWHESGLRNRVIVAVVVAAQAIQIEEPVIENHANRLLWSRQTFESPVVAADAMFRVILAVNKDVAVGAILSATDANIQASVDAAVDTFATGVIE